MCPSVNSAFGTDLIDSFTFLVGSSLTVDRVYSTVSGFSGTKFIVQVKDLVDSRSRFFDVNVARLDDDEPKDNIFGKVGNGIAYTFNVLKIGSDIVIRVANNDTNTLEVTVIRITA